jgi:NADH-quinone oxidoreductase subunit J
MPGVPIVFFILAAIAVGTAVGMLVSRNTIYSALFLVLNFATVAVLYLTLGAPFIALSQITVYAGSIMVLFLFVIMLLGAERLQVSRELRWQPWVAAPLVIILVTDLTLNIFGRVGPLNPVVTPENFGTPRLIGETLFTRFILPFEVVAVILLSATVGAIFLAKPERLSSGQGSRRRRAGAAAPGPSGAPSADAREAPAAQQEETIKETPYR